MSRPRPASPGSAVSGRSMASLPAAADTTHATITAASTSTERLAGDRLEPGIGIFGFLGTLRGRCIDRTGATCALDVGELPIDRTIDAGNRYRITRRHQTVAGID